MEYHGQDLDDVGDIYRCLLKQLLEPAVDEVMQMVLPFYRDRQMDGRRLTATEAMELIFRIVNPARSTTIVIDALDECSVLVRHAILNDLRKLQEQARGLVRLLLSGREMSDVHDAVAVFSNTHVVEMNTVDDIHLYVQTRVQRGFDTNILIPELLPYRSEICCIVESKADGM